MPVSTLTPITTPQKPCRVFISVDLNTLREYDPTIDPWLLTDSGSSLLRKSRNVVTSIATDIHGLLFGPDIALPEINRGLRGYRDCFDCATVELGYDYSFKHDVNDTPILQFTSQSVRGDRLVFKAEQLSEEYRKIVNDGHARQLAREHEHSQSIKQTI